MSEEATTPPAAPPAPPASDKGTVPYDRFQSVVGEKNELKIKLDESLAQVKKFSDAQAQMEATHQTTSANLEVARLEALRLRAASQAGIPFDLADRLQGKTLDELVADAGKIAAHLKPLTPGVPPPAGGAPSPVLKLDEMTPEQIREHAKKAGYQK